MKGNGHITIFVSDEVSRHLLRTVAERCRAGAAFSADARLVRALAGAVAIRLPASRSANDAAIAASPRRKSILALLRPRLPADA